MSRLIRLLLPRFLKDLGEDFTVWRSGKDDERLVPE
jgi:hypothetical protein